MKLSQLGLAFVALALSSPVTLAAEHLGGTVNSADIDGKSVLTGAGGLTLYTFDNDTAGVSNCYDTCAEKWPPLFAADEDTAEGDWTIVERTDGTKMWAYKGAPLYYWVDDAKQGDITGDGVGGVWHLAIE
jgi:predicted lipoprotein with Yx(FWY)xxD motif